MSGSDSGGNDGDGDATATPHGFFRTSRTNDVETPPAMYADLHRVFAFTHDAAPLGYGVRHHVDGLDPAVSWGGATASTYINPPFDRPQPWLERAAREEGQVVVLMPLRMHSEYFADAVVAHADALYTFTSRVTFVGYRAAFQLPVALVLFHCNAPDGPPALTSAGGVGVRRHVLRPRAAPARLPPPPVPAAANVVKSEHLETPAALYAALHAVFRFTHDPAPLGYGAPGSRVANGLDPAVPWGAVNFVHPPHADPRPWLERAVRPESGVCVVLMPFRGHTGYWQQLVDPHTRGFYFVRGGIAFEGHRDRYPLTMTLLLFNYDGEPPALDTLGPYRACYMDTTTTTQRQQPAAAAAAAAGAIPPPAKRVRYKDIVL